MMRSVFVLLVVVLVTFACPVSQAQDLEWFQWTVAEGGNGHEYAVIPTFGTWDEQATAAVSYGAYLATVTSNEEKAFLLPFLWDYYVASKTYRYFWFGLVQDPNGEEPAGGWGWVTGETVEETGYTNWATGEPSNQDGIEDTGAFHGLFGAWVDNPASYLKAAIIERPGGPPPDAEPPTVCLNAPDPAELTPADGRTVSVTLAGSVVDADSGVAQVWLDVDDEYDQLDGPIPFTLGEDGTLAAAADLVATCAAVDADGRTYTISLSAEDTAGNAAEPPVSVSVLVPRDETAPVITLDSPEPSIIWPPQRTVEVTISGQVTDEETGVQSAALHIKDEYGESSGVENITDLDADGYFSVTPAIAGSVTGNDPDGRTYTFWVTAKDTAGNEGSSAPVVVVVTNPNGGGRPDNPGPPANPGPPDNPGRPDNPGHGPK